MMVLGIETSCDDTCVAIYDSTYGILSHSVLNQINIHRNYGGIVPELASREHIKLILPLIKKVINNSSVNILNIYGIAYTAGPGLVGSLLVGASFAKAMACALGIKTIGINHMEGHLLSPMLNPTPPYPIFPFIALLVSGGHTQLILANNIGNYKIIGETIDDAVGEVFDKAARILGLGLNFPGGVEISALANNGKKNRFVLPMPMINKPGFNFSFSGLKTSIIKTWTNCKNSGQDTEQVRCDLALAIETAIVNTLIIKCRKLLIKTNITNLVVAGGVSANKSLRTGLTHMVCNELNGKIFFAPYKYCTDNGAMIAYAGCKRFMAKKHDNSSAIYVRPRWSIESLTHI